MNMHACSFHWLLLLVLQMQEEMTMTYQAASLSSSSSSSAAAAAAAAAGNVCYRYAIVRDVSAQTDIDVCSSSERVSHAYAQSPYNTYWYVLLRDG